MRSLRGRLALLVGVVVAAIVAASGIAISDYTEQEARDSVDDRLRRTAELSQVTAVDAVQESRPRQDRRLTAVLDATGSSLRIFVGAVQVGPTYGRKRLDGPPPPAGLRTVTQGGEQFRVLVTPLPRVGLGALARLEVTSSLRDTLRRQDALDDRLQQLGAAGVVLAVLGAFLAASGVLRPLRRLRLATGRIATEEDLSVRVAETDGPREVRTLAGSFNAMLARLDRSARERERALAATRRFAADAGHELRTPLTTVQATLSALHRHPDVPPAQRTAMLGDALDEQARLVRLLDGLQALARGEASTPDAEDVDLGDLIALVAAEVRDRYPGTTVDTTLPDEPVVVRGWGPGLRLLVGNLAENAAHHGRAGGIVHVTLRAAGRPELFVDDDGPGIDEPQRAHVFEPFSRLDEAADRTGSGLGLALVAQQARAAGATVAVEDSPLGGARFAVRFGALDDQSPRA